MSKAIRNKETGLIFPYTEVLAEQIEEGFIDNLEIIEIESDINLDDEKKKVKKKLE